MQRSRPITLESISPVSVLRIIALKKQKRARLFSKRNLAPFGSFRSNQSRGEQDRWAIVRASAVRFDFAAVVAERRCVFFATHNVLQNRVQRAPVAFEELF
jgi:hypothetical protein